MAELYETLSLLLGIPASVFDMGTALLSILVGFITVLLGPPLAVYWYKKRRYLDHITYTVNELQDKEDGSILLRIRSIELLPRTDLLPSNWMLNLKLLFALRRCTLDNPFVVLEHHDMDVFQPAVISGFSRLFADGFLAEMADLPVHRCDYLLALTFERYGRSASFKLRVLVVKEKDLEKFLDPDFCSKLRFERAHHQDRLTTMRLMAQRRRKECSNDIDDVHAIRVAQGVFRV